MIYDGRKASNELQSKLQKRVATFSERPVLAVISVATHPSIISFIKIKRRFAEAIGVTMEEYDFKESDSEEMLIHKIEELTQNSKISGIIVQLPLPKTFNAQKILDTIPENLDVDVLGTNAWNTFSEGGTLIPPVAGAIAHILHDTHTDIVDKKVVIIGQGKLVGLPVSVWLSHHDVILNLITVDTDNKICLKLYKDADIVISGIGSPHYLKPEYFKHGVILLDAGTSEQSGVLAGDCDPLCKSIASIFTPVPGGIGPLTVAFLFYNLLIRAESKN